MHKLRQTFQQPFIRLTLCVLTPLLLLALLLATSSAAMEEQSQPRSPSASFPVKGSVITPYEDPVLEKEAWVEAVNRDGSFSEGAFTDKDGNFGFELPPDEYIVQAYPQGSLYWKFTPSIPVELVVKEQGVQMDPLMLTFPSVAGRILDPVGNPFKDCPIDVWLEDRLGNQAAYFSYCGSEQPEYLLGGVPAGKYSLQAGAPSGFLPPDPVDVAVEAGSQYDPKATQFIDLQPIQVHLEVKVYDPWGDPIAANVRLWDEKGTIDELQPISPGVPAQFVNLWPGKYRVQAWPTGPDIPELAHSEVWEGLIEPEPGAPPTRLELQLQKPNVVGIVTTPEGKPLPSTNDWEILIEVFDPKALYLEAMTNISGEFSLALPPNEYSLLAHPGGSLLDQYTKSMPHEFGVTALNVQQADAAELAELTVLLTYPRIKGVVVGPDDKPLSAAVEVWNDQPYPNDYWDWDETLVDQSTVRPFRFGGMPKGIYSVQAGPPYDFPDFGPSNVVSFTVEHGSWYLFDSTEWITLYAGGITANVTGTVEFPDGGPVAWADVVVRWWPYPEKDPDWVEEIWTQSGKDGGFAFYDLQPKVDYELQAFPPRDLGDAWDPSKPVPFILASENDQFTATLILQPISRPKHVLGKVTDKAGDPIGDAWVVAQNEETGEIAQTPTLPAGTYTLDLVGGVWRLWVEPRFDVQPPPDWYFPPDWETWVKFTLPPEKEEIIEGVDFVVIRYQDSDFVRVIGQVATPSGDPPPPDSTFIELCNDIDGCFPPKFPAPVDEKGVFEFWAPPGVYELWVHVDPAFGLLPPPPEKVVVEKDPTDLGIIKLTSKQPALVKGRVLDVSNEKSPRGIAGVKVWGWTEEGDEDKTLTDAKGYYTLTLSPGYWHGGLALTLEQKKKYIILPPEYRRGKLPSTGLKDQNFYLKQRNATIRGRVVEVGSGKVLTDVVALVIAENCSAQGCIGDEVKVYNGFFNLSVLGGMSYTLDIWAEGYLPGPDVPAEVFVGANETATTTLSLVGVQTVIQGHLVDVADPLTPLKIDAEVFGFAPAAAYGGPAGEMYEAWDVLWSGKYTFTLQVPTPDQTTGPVTWTLGLWVDPSTGYVADPSHPQYKVVIPPHETQVAQIMYVRKLDTFITGKVFKPDGEPARDVWVFADGVISANSISETAYFEAKTNVSGTYTMYVLPGKYKVGAYVPPHLDLDPPLPQPWASNADNPLNLTFRATTAGDFVSGDLVFSGGTVTFPPGKGVLVFGWSDDGRFNMVTGTTSYSMPISADTTWHLWAAYDDEENDAFYESQKVKVAAPQSGVTLTLTKALHNLPDERCWTFDSSSSKRLSLPAYGDLFEPLVDIRANTMPVSGTVEICAKPTRALPDGHRVIGFAYDLRAWDDNGDLITNEFNKTVRLQFYFPDDITKEELDGVAYYSTVKQKWIALDSPFVDWEDRYATGKINHFSMFGALSALPSAEPADRYIYLPLVLRNH